MRTAEFAPAMPIEMAEQAEMIPDLDARIALAQPEASNQELSLGTRILSTKPGKALTGAITGLTLASPFAAIASAEEPIAESSSHVWSHLGGDPAKDGGVHSIKEFRQVLHTNKGHALMH